MFRKNNNFYTVIVIIALLMLTLITAYAASESGNVSVSARSATLYQPDTNTFLYEKNSGERAHMASTTKIMTALVCLEVLDDLEEIVVIEPECVGIEGSSAYLKVGDLVTVRELLYALMLQSANDAAVTLAYHAGGDIQGFAELMNRKAEQLGLSDTHFTNPHGLDDKDHYTTAHDLAIIAAEAMKNEVFREIASTYKKTIVTADRQRTYTNHNKLLKQYDGAIGIKTGFTDESGRCLVGAAERDGLTFITVTLDAPSDWNDHKKLFDLGFESMEGIALSKVYEFTYELPSIYKNDGNIRVTNTDELYYIVKRGEHKIKKYVNLPRFISEEVEIGDILGYIDFYVDEKYAGRIDLICTESCKAGSKGFFERLRDWLYG